jgi:hypothetical protein
MPEKIDFKYYNKNAIYYIYIDSGIIIIKRISKILWVESEKKQRN